MNGILIRLLQPGQLQAGLIQNEQLELITQTLAVASK